MEAVKWSKLLISSGALLLPASLPYRDTVVEGLYSLSQLLSLLMDFQAVEISTRNAYILKISRFANLALSNTEIFLENLALTFGDNSLRRKLILFLEASKATCRLIQVLSWRQPMMIINWDKGQPFNTARQTPVYDTYLQYYTQRRLPVQRLHPHTNTSQHSFTATHDILSTIQLHQSKEEHFIRDNTDTYRGRRSGIQLRMQSVQEPVIQQPYSPLLSTPELDISSPTTETLLPPTKPTSTHLSHDQLLLLGEVLYILRPLIYSVLTLQCTGNESSLPFLSSSEEEEDSQASILMKIRTWMNKLGSETLMQAVILLFCFIIELSSIQLTSEALRQKRQLAAATSSGVTIIDSMERTEDVPYCEERSLRFLSGSRTTHAFDIELRRRKMALYYYLLRSPLFDRATLPLLRVAVKKLQSVPVLGSLLMPEYVLSVLMYVNKFHFYNSNS
mmetsp:Transcript_29559/g.42209  ORF Transcript_29559/g.42209 Transcript_29559/m.42209 type:complete len:448 (+) Transcript_29559:83-1426(+)